MNHQSPMLHWSFDYQYKNSNRSFREDLVPILQSARREFCRERHDAKLLLEYQALPNFWSGYLEEERAQDSPLALGHVSIARTPTEEDQFRWQLETVNQASGERLQLDYLTTREETPRLTGNWRIHSTNAANDLYRELRIEGRLNDAPRGQDILLRTGDGQEFRTASLPSDAFCTCNWSLFAMRQTAITASPQQPFNILEDLEKLKTACQFRLFDHYDLAMDSCTMSLEGCCLQGHGQPPSYWWFDNTGRLVIMSSTFQTFVLTSEQWQEPDA